MKKRIFIAIILLLAPLGYFLSLDYDHKNEIVYFGGDILTMNDAVPSAEAVYIKDGKIVALGSKEKMLALTSSNAKLIDLKGKTLMPGFFDPHGHLDFATIFDNMVNISGFKYKTPEEVWKVVKETAQKGKKDEWIFFYGLDPILTKGLKSPTIQYLDSLAPDKPIMLMTKALHVFYANSKAFENLGITAKTPNPSKASYYERDAQGKLTGAVIEQAALEPFRLKIQEKAIANFASNTQKVLTEYAKLGVTSSVNMGLSVSNKNVLSLYEHLTAEKSKPLFNFLELIGKLPKRQANPRMFLYLRKEYEQFLPKKSSDGDDFFKIVGMKFWYDGSPYSGSMYLKKPYMRSNFTINGIHLNPNHTSESLLKVEELQALVEKYQSKGWKIAVHCQGDQAIEEAMEAFSNIDKKEPIKPYRHRLEHCMMLPKSVMSSMKNMGISPSFHINHLLYYGDFLKSDVIGAERAEQIFPINSFAQEKIPYSLHADMPMFEPNPLSLISTSVNRKTEAGLSINPSESVAVLDALKSMTIYAAWQLKMEDKLGSIEVGKYADLVILDQNPLKIAPEAIGKIKVNETIVAGNTIWKVK